MQSASKNSWIFIISGILFAFIWGSGSTITKYGLQYLQPWVLVVCRLLFAAIIMLTIAHLILGYTIPQRKHWKSIFICGLLNLSIFLGMYTYALQFVPGGLGTLMTSIIPIFITLFSGLYLKKKISVVIIFSLIICFTGVFIAAWPILQFNKETAIGMLILLTGIISNAAGAVYYVGKDWEGIKILTINAWQTLVGGLILLPMCLYNFNNYNNYFCWQSIASVGWLALFLSFVAILLWLFLLRQNTVRAAFWLFLCPVVGFGLAAILLHETISGFTATGVLLVVTGLYLSQRKP